MSAATKAAVDAAIQAHLADEAAGAILTGYVLQAQYTTMAFVGEQLTGYMRMVAEVQNFTTTLGLAHYMRRDLEFGMSQEVGR